jgi:YfiH family protein
MILRVDAWAGQPWISHGFGTRLSGQWTHQPGRTWVHQIHSAEVVHAREPGAQGQADALATAEPGLLLEIRTADCLPVLIADPVNRAVAAIHAGWRGSAAGIVLRTIEKMAEWFGSSPENLQAAIGPSIAACCFEVGPEVAVEFGLAGRCRVDLVAHNRRLLESAKVREIFVLAECTRCDASRFHSFRRDRELAGRMEAGIQITDGTSLAAGSS